MQPPRLRLTAMLAAGSILLAACASPGSPTPGLPTTTPSASGQPTGSPSTEPTGQPSSAPSASPDATTYTVRAGDTLFSIARSWGTTVAQLQAWNAERYPSLAADPNDLEAGWVIIVSGDPSATPVATPAATATPVPSAP
ncbi:MAG: LysM peptidoglycan-binding domain-containing protein, partial [Candidatus Limnocylindria bacterium]